VPKHVNLYWEIPILVASTNVRDVVDARPGDLLLGDIEQTMADTLLGGGGRVISYGTDSGDRQVVTLDVDAMNFHSILTKFVCPRHRCPAAILAVILTPPA